MENYNNFASTRLPQDDYALTLLTQAAMHKRRPAESLNTSLAYSGPERHRTDTVTSSNHLRASNNNRTPDILSDYNSNVLSTRAMETLSFNPPLSRQNQYMNGAFQGIGSQIAQNYANGLGILNAESYDDGRSGMRDQDAQEFRARARNDKTMPFGIEQALPRAGLNFENQTVASEDDLKGKGRRSKKRKDESADDDEEARKKARGRPRVDTKDETAADVSFVAISPVSASNLKISSYWRSAIWAWLYSSGT